MRQSTSIGALVQEPEGASIDHLIRQITKVCVRRALHRRWPRMELSQFPVTRRFHIDTNHNAVVDAIVTTQAVVIGDEVIAVIKAVELLPDCDLPLDREPSDVPADAIEHVKMATLGGC